MRADSCESANRVALRRKPTRAITRLHRDTPAPRTGRRRFYGCAAG